MGEESGSPYAGVYLIPVGVAVTWLAFLHLYSKASRRAKEDILKESGTTSALAMRIVGDEASALTYLCHCGPEFNVLAPGSRIGVCITSSFEVGRVRAIVFEVDPRFPRSNWKVDRVDLWDQTRALHYVFVINRVLLFAQRLTERFPPLDAEGGAQVPVGVRFARTLRQFHLPLSVLDFPYGSRFTRVQRLASVMALGLDAMLVDCALHGWCPERGGPGINLGGTLLSTVYLSAFLFVGTLVITFAFEFCYQGADRGHWPRPADLDHFCKTPKTMRAAAASRADSSREVAYRHYSNQDASLASPQQVQPDGTSLRSKTTIMSPQFPVDAAAIVAHADGLRLRQCYPSCRAARLLPWALVVASMLLSTPAVCVCAACYDFGTCVSWLLPLTAAAALTCFVLEPAKALLIAFVFRDF
ncbi:uncharacterized protein [Dermacentor albipictus]|uniref:uncharacterized protein isoform X2 n=1 Tax=Dermacentor albipictus TaxID=60249 RepID=UPI0038FC3729